MARSRGSGRRTDYSWFGTSGQISTMDLAEGTDALGDEALSFGASFTIHRIRGTVAVELDAGAATNERALVSMGLIVVSVNAFNAGIASVPHPDDDSGDDWIWYDYAYVSTGQSQGATEVLTREIEIRMIDTKAMRKIKTQEALCFVASIEQSADGTGALDLAYGFRTLLGS